MTDFSDKIILITGASSGMGRSSALDLAKKGAKALTLFSRTKENLDKVAEEIAAVNDKTQVLVVVGDGGKAEDLKRAVDETVAKFGGLTGAFINAGMFAGGKPIPEFTDEEIDNVINLNIKGVMYALRYIIPAIKATVGDDVKAPTGSIVLNTSCMGEVVIGPKSGGASMYSASKAFANSITETAAIENAPRIRVNAVMPGVVKTNIMPVDDATYDMVGAKVQPLWGRAGTADEVAALVSFLLGDEASFISGTKVKVDGLWSMSGGSFE